MRIFLFSYFVIACFLVTAFIPSSQAKAAEDGNYVLTLKDDTFSPDKLILPAHQKIKLIVKNESNANAEWESSELDREKVVQAHSEITVLLGPLDPGSYKFFNDFHRETTGVIIVK